MIKFELVSKYEGQEDLMPVRGTKGSAGYDLKCAEDMVIPSHIFAINSYLMGQQHPIKPMTIDELKEEKTLKKLGIAPILVPTGVKAIFDNDIYGAVESRSGIPMSTLLIVSNGEGVIDSDYSEAKNEGHIHVQFINLSPFPIQLKRGDRIAQLLFKPIKFAENDTYLNENRVGGFNSTGHK